MTGGAGDRRPLVGLTTYRTGAAWGPWQAEAALVATAYTDLVWQAGGRPVLLPPGPDAAGTGAGADEVIAALDALVLVGGGDLAPSTYGGPDRPEIDGVDGRRDASELALVHAALHADLPLLAICRGLQLLNVALGGTLIPHLPDVTGHPGHRPAPGTFGPVDVTTAPGSRAAAIWGRRATVCCSHHQAVDRLGEGLVVTARSVEPAGSPLTGGVVEAAELPGRRFVLGVQWHPEESGDRRPFAALAAAVTAVTAPSPA